MGFVYRSLANYEALIYIGLAIWGLFVFRSMYRTWREWRDSVFSLEREFALRRLGRITAIALLILGLMFAEFFISTFVAPSLPASDILTTPTLDLLAAPPGTLSAADATQAALSTGTQSVPSGMSGCVPDQIMISSPQPGEIVNGSIQIIGTANVPNFGFYKYEIAPIGTQSWTTISAGREAKQDKELGAWNTGSLTNGEYFLRLVITDNEGGSLEPCVIAVRVANQ